MATLTVNLDDQASEALDELAQRLEKLGEFSETSSTGITKLNAAQNQQLTVINRQTAGWSQLAAVAVPAIGTVTAETLKMAAVAVPAVANLAATTIRGSADIVVSLTKVVEPIAKLGETTIRAVGDISTTTVEMFGAVAIGAEKAYIVTVKAAESVAKFAIVAGASVGIVKTLWGAHGKGAKDTGDELDEADKKKNRFFGMSMGSTALIGGLGGATAAARSNSLAWEAVEFGTKKAVTSFLKIGPPVAAATILLKSYEAAASMTGKTQIELADGTIKLESNLDRFRESTGKFKSSIVRDFGEAGEAVSAWWNEASFTLPELGAWKTFDETVTFATKQIVSDVTSLNKAYDSGVISLRSFAVQIMGGNGEAYRSEIALIRELKQVHKDLEAQRDLERDGFKLLADANKTLQQRESERAEQEKINSIKTIEELNNEVLAYRQFAGEQAKAGNMNSAQAEYHVKTMEALEKRRGEIVKESAKQQEEAAKQLRETQKTAFDAQVKEFDELLKQDKQLADAEKKRAESAADHAKSLTQTKNNESLSEDLADAKATLEMQKLITAEKMKSGGKKEAEIKAKMAEMDIESLHAEHALRLKYLDEESQAALDDVKKRREEVEKSDRTEHEKAMELVKLGAEEDKTKFDAERKRITEIAKLKRDQSTIESKEERDRIQEKYRLEKELHDKQKAEAEKIGHGFDAKGFMGGFDQQQVLRQVQENRAKQEKENQGLKDQWMLDSGDPKNKAKFEQNQRTAAAKGRRSAYNDAENGQLDQGEISKAQSDLAQQTIQTQVQQGKLNSNQAKVLTDAVKAQANQQDAIDSINQTLAAIINAQKGIKNASTASANVAKTQAGSLN